MRNHGIKSEKKEASREAVNSMMTKFEAMETPMKSSFATSVIFLGMLTAPLYAQTVNWSVDSNHSDAFAIYSASSTSPAILFWLSVLVMIGFFLYPFIRVHIALKREEERLRRHDPNEAETKNEDDEEIVGVEKLEDQIPRGGVATR